MNNVQDWSTEQVAKWFSSIIGCEQYTSLVMKEDLDGALLVKLKDQEWFDFGIKNSFHRKKIVSKVARLLETKNVEPSAIIEAESCAAVIHHNKYDNKYSKFQSK